MATETLNIGQNYEIEEVLAELLYTQGEGKDLLLQMMPLRYSDTSMLVWDQPENGYGLLGLRGQDGEPEITQPTGYRQYSMRPGYYGAQVSWGEREMTDGREFGTPNEPISLDRLVARASQHLTLQTLNQVRSIVADVLTTGRVNRRSADGRITHSATIDGFAANNVFTPAIGWAASPTTAVPIDDLLGWQNTLNQGTSTDFGPASRLVCQQSVVNELLATTQIRSTFRSRYGSTINGFEDLNTLMIGFNLPKIELYNAGYYPLAADATGRTRANWTRFLPVKKLIWDGVREGGGQKAQFQLTRNMVNRPPIAGVGSPDLRWSGSDLPQARFGDGLWATANYKQLPPKFEVAMGFNGGPVVRYVTGFAAISYS